MGNFGDGLDSWAIELNPDIAKLQAQNQGTSVALVNAPDSGFVSSINGLSSAITIQSGTSATGVTVTVTSDGVSTIAIGVLGITAPGVAKSNVAVVAPTTSDDESMGYARFSQWIDSTLNDFYVCTDPATLAAVWRKLN